MTVGARLESIIQQNWCVHNTPPTAHTKVIEEYLGRYICRIGVSNKRLNYDEEKEKVILQYNDYKNQETNKAAPKAYKTIEPLVAIDQIITHVLPANFQKVRYYGLMTSTMLKKIHKGIPQLVKENKQTIRTLFQIVKALLKIEDEGLPGCAACGSTEIVTKNIAPDKIWYDTHIRKNRNAIINKSPDSKANIKRQNPPSHPEVSQPLVPKTKKIS